MNIRRATEADAALICELARAVQEIHVVARPDIFKPLEINAEMLALTRARLSGENDYFYIAEIDGHAVGYAYAQIIERPPNPFTYPITSVLVDQISVNPEYRGQGIGAALMEQVYALAREKDVRRISLAVWSFNQDAVRFYEREGFSVYNVRMEKVLE
jgi:GNAT superfamily N-acetyltransferase